MSMFLELCWIPTRKGTASRLGEGSSRVYKEGLATPIGRGSALSETS